MVTILDRSLQRDHLRHMRMSKTIQHARARWAEYLKSDYIAAAGEMQVDDKAGGRKIHLSDYNVCDSVNTTLKNVYDSGNSFVSNAIYTALCAAMMPLGKMDILLDSTYNELKCLLYSLDVAFAQYRIDRMD